MWKFLIIAVISLLWAFQASEGFDKLKKPSHTGCNNTFHSINGRFDLNFHNLSTPCHWTINVTREISLSLFDVFLHETDNLNFYRNVDDASNQTNPLLKNPIPFQNGTITFITNETLIVIWLSGTTTAYDRVLEGYYSNGDCSIPVGPDVKTLYSPVYLGDFSGDVKCEYRFNQIPHIRVKQVFTFEKFNMSSSVVEIHGSTLSSEIYKNENHPTDFFLKDKLVSIDVTPKLNSNDYFVLKIHEVDSSCSGVIEADRTGTQQLSSPPIELNNGSITVFECRWLVESKTSSDILGIKFDKLDFSNVLDIVAVNDGRSEISNPLLQVTTSNRNITKDQVVRTSSSPSLHSSLWIAFKPVNYKSSFIANITVHGQGGYLKNSGEIVMHSTDGDDTAFLLEVDDNEVVMLNFEDSSILPPATISIYDGFNTNNLLTILRGQIKFPILSRSSRMMVTGTKFSTKSNHFSAKFKGVNPSCNQMSSTSSGNYILTENCNSSCVWVMPPQNLSSSALVVYLQYISLKKGDNLKIHKLDASLTLLAEIEASENHVPHISVPGDIGLLINVTQSYCETKTDKIILIGHSSYIPACNQNIIPKATEFLQVSSPLYPDTYPVFANCQWNISASKESIMHMAFDKLNLAKNHCIKISQKSTVYQYEGKTLPNDLFLNGDAIVDFDSSGCNKSEVGSALNSAVGFLLNITVTDCGAVFNSKSGEFNTGNKSLCIWKVSVPPTDGNSVNIISYVVNEKDKLKNYEFHVYDGSTVRDSEIVNNTDSKIWSRTNTLIFLYKRLNATQLSATLDVKYDTISCGPSMQCGNKLCMHPDWKCNGENDCGDFSDERNCASEPLPPPEVHTTGYSATAFWFCIFAMVIIGVILGVTVPVCYQRYRDSRYRRFHELDPSA